MPLFEIQNDKLKPIEQTNFSKEKMLHQLIEKNLSAVFNCRKVASEFSTGGVHAGRIDSLALSEDNNPVIIEYKKKQSAALINQSLFYLYWIKDHKGDFERVVQKSLGSQTEVDWSNIRVICLAPTYNRYDLFAVQAMETSIELWKYRLFKNGAMYLEEIVQGSKGIKTKAKLFDGEHESEQLLSDASNSIKRQGVSSESYSLEDHLHEKSEKIRALVYEIRDGLRDLDSSIDEVPLKKYVAYRTSQNLVCMEVLKRSVKLHLKLDADEIATPPSFYRDVTHIGHYGTGNSEFMIRSLDDLEELKPFLEQVYNKVGG